MTSEQGEKREERKRETFICGNEGEMEKVTVDVMLSETCL